MRLSFGLLAVGKVPSIYNGRMHVINTMRVCLLELSGVLRLRLHWRHCRFLDATFLGYETILNNLVNILSFTQRCFVIQIKQPHLVMVVLRV